MEKYGILPIGSYWLSCDYLEYKNHLGIDIGYKRTIGYATEVWAWKSGVVVDSNYRSDSGNYVIVQHDHGTYRQWTRYLHLDSRKVKVGDIVKQGDVVGIRGNTGNSKGAHLHFQITAQVPLTQEYNRDWCASSGIDPKPLMYKSKEKEYVLDDSFNFIKDMPSEEIDTKDYKTMYEYVVKEMQEIEKVAKKYV